MASIFTELWSIQDFTEDTNEPLDFIQQIMNDTLYFALFFCNILIQQCPPSATNLGYFN